MFMNIQLFAGEGNADWGQGISTSEPAEQVQSVTYKHLTTSNGTKIQVDSAIRDGDGNCIATVYAAKSDIHNQKVKTSSVTFGADDVVEIVAGSNVQVAGDTSAKTITISATDTTYISRTATKDGTALSLVTTGEKYKWNSVDYVFGVQNGQKIFNNDTIYINQGIPDSEVVGLLANLQYEQGQAIVFEDDTDGHGGVYAADLETIGQLYRLECTGYAIITALTTSGAVTEFDDLLYITDVDNSDNLILTSELFGITPTNAGWQLLSFTSPSLISTVEILEGQSPSIINNYTNFVSTLFTTDSRLLNYVDETCLTRTDPKIASWELSSNKVTSISSSSTDTQYPSAKCVYDLVDDKMDKVNPTGSGNFSLNSGIATNNSVAIGADTNASGSYSHAEGHHTNVSGLFSHVEGFHTEATKNYQHVFGEYNKVDSENDPLAHGQGRGRYIEVVGNGNFSQRNNARTLDWDGNEVLAGGLTIGANSTLSDGTNNITVADIVNKQDSLPNATNDRYLHTNASSGALEWSTINSFPQIINNSSGSISVTINPQTVYVFTSTSITNLNITLGTASSDMYKYYRFDFVTGNTLPTVTLNKGSSGIDYLFYALQNLNTLTTNCKYSVEVDNGLVTVYCASKYYLLTTSLNDSSLGNITVTDVTTGYVYTGRIVPGDTYNVSVTVAQNYMLDTLTKNSIAISNPSNFIAEEDTDIVATIIGCPVTLTYNTLQHCTVQVKAGSSSAGTDIPSGSTVRYGDIIYINVTPTVTGYTAAFTVNGLTQESSNLYKVSSSTSPITITFTETPSE